jgi:copper chaperone CopZ
MMKILVIPAAIVVLILVAFATTSAYRVPTVQISFVEERPSAVERVELTVDGLTCRGKSMLCARQIGDVPGLVSLTTYVRTHTAVIEYDPTVTDLETIKNVLCTPITHEGQSYRVFSIEG